MTDVLQSTIKKWVSKFKERTVDLKNEHSALEEPDFVAIQENIDSELKHTHIVCMCVFYIIHHDLIVTKLLAKWILCFFYLTTSRDRKSIAVFK